MNECMRYDLDGHTAQNRAGTCSETTFRVRGNFGMTLYKVNFPLTNEDSLNCGRVIRSTSPS